MNIKCILCNSEAVFTVKFSSQVKTGKNRGFMRCPVCDLIFVPDSFHLLPKDEAGRYRLHNNTLLNEGYVGIFLEKIALFHRYCPGIDSVLDYGCGPEPVLSELLKGDGYDCDIYDPYFFPELPEKSYDLVISTEVFEHFRNIRAELYKIRSLLNPGGFLAVMTSFHDAVVSFEDWWYVSDPTHICFLSARTFDWIAKQFGFKIIYTNRRNFIILQR